MIATIIIASITFAGVIASILFFPHIHFKNTKLDTYWMIALFGAVILLAFGFAPIKYGAIISLPVLTAILAMVTYSHHLKKWGLLAR